MFFSFKASVVLQSGTALASVLAAPLGSSWEALSAGGAAFVVVPIGFASGSGNWRCSRAALETLEDWRSRST